MKKVLSIFMAVMALVCCGSCSHDDDPGGGSKDAKNVRVWITSASITKIKAGSYRLSYTVKSSGVSASKIRTIGCSAYYTGSGDSSKSGVTSYSYTHTISRVNENLTAYVILTSGEKIKRKNSVTVSGNSSGTKSQGAGNENNYTITYVD